MRPFSTLVRVIAASSMLAGCGPESASPPDTERSNVSAGILTSFDRLTLSRGESSSFSASLIGAGARLSSGGLTFASRATGVANVTATNGRARVEGRAAGRTWVVVQSAAGADSVEVIVE